MATTRRTKEAIKQDKTLKAKPAGVRTVTKKGKTSNQYGTFKNKVGSTYSESRPNRSDKDRRKKI
jgi:hypothetical protein